MSRTAFNAMMTIVLVSFGWNDRVVQSVEGPATNLSPDSDVVAFHLSVMDRHSGEPVPNADLDIVIHDRQEKGQTDRFGQCLIPLRDPNPESLEITVSKEGYVPMALRFRPRKTGITIPADYELKLERGIPIGGTVQTREGKLVSDAIVSIETYVYDRDEIEQRVSKLTCPTDVNGRWACRILPELSRDVWVDIEHDVYARPSGKPNIWIVDLRSGRHVIEVQPKPSLSGVVLTPEGQPIAGAEVFLGDDRYQAERQTTDGRGAFRYGKLKPGKHILTVVAEGYAQDMQSVHLQSDVNDLTFSLRRGVSVRFRVIDSSKRPVAGARVEADVWRRRGLYGTRGRNIRLWAETDDNGVAVWKDCPEDGIDFNVYKSGYTYTRKYLPLGFLQRTGTNTPPRENSQNRVYNRVITLKPQGKTRGRVHGRVYDAQTRNPIQGFRMIECIQGNNEELTPQTHKKRHIESGEFELSLTHRDMAVRIEADGYLPGQTPVVTNDSLVHRHDVYLTPLPTKEITGTVTLSDGTPAIRADIWIAEENHGLFVQGWGTMRSGGFARTQSDERGWFTVKTPLTEDYTILVMHGEGVAETDRSQFEEKQVIALEPWARVEGRVDLQGDESRVYGVELEMSDSIFTERISFFTYRIFFAFEAPVDAKGHFSFARVKAGTAKIAKMIERPNGNPGRSNPIRAELIPGRTTIVDFSASAR